MSFILSMRAPTLLSLPRCCFDWIVFSRSWMAEITIVLTGSWRFASSWEQALRFSRGGNLFSASFFWAIFSDSCQIAHVRVHEFWAWEIGTVRKSGAGVAGVGPQPGWPALSPVKHSTRVKLVWGFPRVDLSRGGLQLTRCVCSRRFWASVAVEQLI